MAGWKLQVGCCSGLQWVGGLGDGWLETAGRVLQWVTVGGGTGRRLAGNCCWVLQWVTVGGGTGRRLAGNCW